MASRSLAPGVALLVVLGVVAPSAGCSGPPGAGRQLGADLGTFHVAASEAENGCGAGVLGASSRFEFEIELSREHSELYWGQRRGIVIEPSLAFELEASMIIPISERRPGVRGCAIQRRDRIEGTLEARSDGDVTGFAGSMSYAFATDPTATCSFDEQLAAGLPRLPCQMSYGLEAERTRAPEQGSEADSEPDAPPESDEPAPSPQ
jgi:hypothetical protein